MITNLVQMARTKQRLENMKERKAGRRSAEDAEKTKCEIMSIAANLFCERGYERVSLRNISERAGVSHSLIRHHFGSKEKIWHAISDGLHQYFEEYLNVIVEHFPKDSTANEKLYFFTVKVLAHMLIEKRPIQLLADGIRQDELTDYFIDRTHKVQLTIAEMAADYNQNNPQNQVNIWEVKWLMMMFAQGASSLAPIMHTTWEEIQDDHSQCLLKHWGMFNQMMAFRFNVPEDKILRPKQVSDLVHSIPCNLMG